MATLLMRFVAPMQAWDTQSHFSHRSTEREPSKSGVIGLLCAALGVARDDNHTVNELSMLRMGVRVDQEGQIRRDYHTAGKGGYYQVDGKIERDDLITSNRYYLHDAKFLVGLEGDIDMLYQLQSALQNPTWFLFLGRKACIPSERIWLPDGVQENDLETTLAAYPWLGKGELPERLRTVIEDTNGSTIRHDRVVSFAQRRFLPRRIRVEFISTPSISKEE